MTHTDSSRDLAASFLRSHPSDAARLMEGLGSDDAGALLDALPPEASAAALAAMDPSAGAAALALATPGAAGAALAALPVDTAAGLLRRMGSPERGAALEGLAARRPELAEPVARLLRFPEETAGALMDPLVATLPEDITAGEALARVRRRPEHAIYYVYVLDREQHLAGVLTLRMLMLADPDEAVGALMRTNVVRLQASAGRETIAAHPGWRAVHALPVVDASGRFLGAIRYETLRRLEEDDAAGGAGSPGLAAAMDIGTLTWLGMMQVLGGLLGATTASATALGSEAGADGREDAP